MLDHLDLGRLKKGSLLFDAKQKSFQQIWMGSKVGKNSAKQVGYGDQLTRMMKRKYVLRGAHDFKLHCKK